MKDYLLGPDGQMHSLSQLDRLSMAKVFDMLVALGVSDNEQYREFLDLKRPKSRSRSHSRPRSRSRRHSRTHYVYGYPHRSSPKTRYVYLFPRSSRKSATKAPSSSTGYQTNCAAKGEYSCKSSDKICNWNPSTRVCSRK